MNHPQEVSKSDLQALEIQLGQLLGMFMYENSELSCWNFIMGVNGVPTFYMRNHCSWVQ